MKYPARVGYILWVAVEELAPHGKLAWLPNWAQCAIHRTECHVLDHCEGWHDMADAWEARQVARMKRDGTLFLDHPAWLDDSI
jgi:hypothetical protein